MILTSTRLRRWPSRLPGQTFRLALKDPLPGVKGSGEQSETIQLSVCHWDNHQDSEFQDHNTPSGAPPRPDAHSTPSQTVLVGRVSLFRAVGAHSQDSLQATLVLRRLHIHF